MNIYLIEHEKFDIYDAYSGHVVAANNKKEVIDIAKEGSADEGKEIWDTAKITLQGKYTGVNKKPFKILSDFMAG